MAWDKVTKIDSIAKRKPHTKANLGKLQEYHHAYGSKAWENFQVGDTIAQRTVVIGKSGKMRRYHRHGPGNIATNWPTR